MDRAADLQKSQGLGSLAKLRPPREARDVVDMSAPVVWVPVLGRGRLWAVLSRIFPKERLGASTGICGWMGRNGRVSTLWQTLRAGGGFPPTAGAAWQPGSVCRRGGRIPGWGSAPQPPDRGSGLHRSVWGIARLSR